MSLSCHHAPQLLAELQWLQGQSRQARQQQSCAVLRVAHAGLSTCRAVTPEHLVGSPLGVEQRKGGVWIVLTHLDSSFLQLEFPLDFHLGTLSNMSDGQ